MMSPDRLRQIPPWAWIVIAAAAGLIVLTYHRYAQDDTDTDWTSPKEADVPVVAMFPIVPGQRTPGSPMSLTPGFRPRSYPGSLTHADFSIIGGLGA